MPNTPKVIALEWIATALLILNAILTSINIYPANVFVALLGGIMWTWISIIWKRWSLIVLNLTLLIIYVGGLLWKTL